MEIPSVLYKAAKAGASGRRIEGKTGTILIEGFAYLTGQPDEELLENIPKLVPTRQMVCENEAWQEALLTRYPQLNAVTRSNMKVDMASLDRKKLRGMTDGTVLPVTFFTREIFDARPFGHCDCYDSFESFCSTGSGYAALDGSTVAAACSSHLTFAGEVELNFSTRPEYRRRGLGLACAASMVLDCLDKGLTVHWDAQNPASRRLAERIGFVFDGTYQSFTFQPYVPIP